MDETLAATVEREQSCPDSPDESLDKRDEEEGKLPPAIVEKETTGNDGTGAAEVSKAQRATKTGKTGEEEEAETGS